MKRWLPLVLLVVMAGCHQPLAQVKPLATAANQDITAYAMGNANGAGGPAVIGIVAVHPKTAGNAQSGPILAYGTRVSLSASAAIPDQNGTPRSYSSFTVRDLGDIRWSYHPDSPYWLDVYFGRYIRKGDSCSCGYVPQSGYCTEAQTNSCQNALRFGVQRRSVTY